MLAPTQGVGRPARVLATSALVAPLALVLSLAGSAAASSPATSPKPVEAPREPDLDPLERLATFHAAAFATKANAEGAGDLLALLALTPRLRPAFTEELLAPWRHDPALDRSLAAQVGYVLARTAEDLGQPETAGKIRQGLGFLTQPWVVGPFGEGRASLDSPAGPESSTPAFATIDETSSFEGKMRPVRWRAGGEAIRRGTLLLDGLLRPDTQAVAYVAYGLASPRPGWAALHLGSSGPLAVWCNGRRIFRRDVVRALGFDQDVVALPLVKGNNQLVVKTVVTDGPWRLVARVTELDGSPWTGHEVAAPSLGTRRATSAAATGKAPMPASLATVIGALPGMNRTRWSVAQQLTYGRWLAFVHPADRDAKEDVTALEEAVNAGAAPTWSALLTLADVARETDDRRAALERALAETAKLPESPLAHAVRSIVLTELGETARAQERLPEALRRWREALTEDPACWQASLALAQEEQAAGLPALALARLQALPGRARSHPEVLHAEVRALANLGRRREAMALLEALLAQQAVDADLWHERGGWRLAQNDAAGALADLTRASELRPDVVSYGLDVARLEEGQGAKDTALTTMAALEARLPDDGSIPAARGRLLQRLGRLDEAVAAWELALARSPEDVELRRALGALKAERRSLSSAGATSTTGESDDLARRFAADGRALLEADRAHPRTASVPAEADIWLDRKVVRVHPNGLAETFAQRLVEVKTDAAVANNKDFYVRYTPGAEEVEILVARILRRERDGRLTILEASGRDDEDLSEPWYGLYYDYRAEIVRFDGLRPGDVLEVQYVVAGVFQDRQMQNYYGDLDVIAESNPKRAWDYTLLASPSRKFYTNASNVPGLKAEEPRATGQPDEQQWRFSMTDVPKLDAEPAMPGIAEVAPLFHVSTYGSWKDVGAWYWHLVEEQLLTDEPLRRAVRGVLKPGMSTLDKVRAIHDLVLSSTRYVGLEFGIHGFKPYKVTQVFSRRFGDCKDKASLLVAMLREAGVDADMVLVRTRRGGRIDPWPASLAVFDHAIAYVPSLDLYLDGTAEFSGLSELPGEDQGVMVVRIGPHGTKLAETPVLPAKQNKAARHWTIALAANGDADVRETLTVTGQAAPEWRDHYQTPGEQHERYEKVWTGRHPASSLLELDMRGIADRNEPVRVAAHAHVPRLAAASGDERGGLSLPVSVREADFARTYTRLSKRTYDLVLAYPWDHLEELVWDLPPGLVPARLPENVRMETPFASFSATTVVEPARAGSPAKIKVRTELEVRRHRFSPTEYQALRRFFGQVDAILADRILVIPQGGTS